MRILFFQRNSKKEGFITLYAYIAKDGKRTTAFTTNITIQKDTWDNKNKVILGKDRYYNVELEDIRDNIHMTYRELLNKGLDTSAQSIKSAYLAPNKSIEDLVDELLEEVKAEVKTGTFKGYVNFANPIKSFFKGKSVADLNVKLVQQLASHILKVYSGKTPVSCFGFFKRVVRYGILHQHINDISLLEVKLGKKCVNNIPHEKKVINLNLDLSEEIKVNKNRQATIDLFNCQRMTGMAYIDTQEFNIHEHLFHDAKTNTLIISKQRVKSKKWFVTPITPPLMELLQKYRGMPKVAYQTYSRHLRFLSKLYGIRITSHMARHTFADNMQNREHISMDTLIKMMGHSSASMTETYTSVNRQRVISEATQKLNLSTIDDLKNLGL